MEINTIHLQRILDNADKYLIVNKSYGGPRDTCAAALITIEDPPQDFPKDIGQWKYNDIIDWANREIPANIFLGSQYAPFQYGLRLRDIVDVCPIDGIRVMDLVVRCHNEKISRFEDVVRLAESMAAEAQSESLHGGGSDHE